MHQVVGYEVGGYPSEPSGIRPEVWRCGVLGGRVSKVLSASGAAQEQMFTQSIQELETQVGSAEAALGAARDPDVSLSSSNPMQYVIAPTGNQLERSLILSNTTTAAQRLASRKALLYDYAVEKNVELKFSGIADDVFSRIRQRVDSSIGKAIPAAVKRLSSIYDNLASENPEDWSNAAHGCRRVLMDLADAVFPPTDQTRSKLVGGKETKIKLGKENYINRIRCFVEDHSNSERFSEIVGSHADFLGDRLESIVEAANKGTHADIISREEADRYVVYTYLLVGDVLTLLQEQAA
jgi:hypothetical protein